MALRLTIFFALWINSLKQLIFKIITVNLSFIFSVIYVSGNNGLEKYIQMLYKIMKNLTLLLSFVFLLSCDDNSEDISVESGILKACNITLNQPYDVMIQDIRNSDESDPKVKYVEMAVLIVGDEDFALSKKALEENCSFTQVTLENGFIAFVNESETEYNSCIFNPYHKRINYWIRKW